MACYCFRTTSVVAVVPFRFYRGWQNNVSNLLIPHLTWDLIRSFSRSLRENEPKEGCYPQGPLQRGMQLTTVQTDLRQSFGKVHKAFALKGEP